MRPLAVQPPVAPLPPAQTPTPQHFGGSSFPSSSAPRAIPGWTQGPPDPYTPAQTGRDVRGDLDPKEEAPHLGRWALRVLASIGAATVIAWLVAHVGSDGDTVASSPAAMTCERLGDAAAAMDHEHALVTLLDVREARATVDHRSDYTLPTGADDATVLECEGTGVWSDGSKSPVRVRLTVDAEGESWVYYEPI